MVKHQADGVDGMNHTQTAQQGHRYTLGDRSVIAMQSGVVVQVREIDQSEAYPLGAAITVKASWLKPERMVYFHGEVPS
jgi:hypothetical protein